MKFYDRENKKYVMQNRKECPNPFKKSWGLVYWFIVLSFLLKDGPLQQISG